MFIIYTLSTWFILYIQFVGVEGVVTFVVDLYPNVFRRGYRREMLIAVICIISFLVGLSMVCQVRTPPLYTIEACTEFNCVKFYFK